MFVQHLSKQLLHLPNTYASVEAVTRAVFTHRAPGQERSIAWLSRLHAALNIPIGTYARGLIGPTAMEATHEHTI